MLTRFYVSFRSVAVVSHHGLDFPLRVVVLAQEGRRDLGGSTIRPILLVTVL